MEFLSKATRNSFKKEWVKTFIAIWRIPGERFYQIRLPSQMKSILKPNFSLSETLMADSYASDRSCDDPEISHPVSLCKWNGKVSFLRLLYVIEWLNEFNEFTSAIQSKNFVLTILEARYTNTNFIEV